MTNPFGCRIYTLQTHDTTKQLVIVQGGFKQKKIYVLEMLLVLSYIHYWNSALCRVFLSDTRQKKSLRSVALDNVLLSVTSTRVGRETTHGETSTLY